MNKIKIELIIPGDKRIIAKIKSKYSTTKVKLETPNIFFLIQIKSQKQCEEYSSH